MSDLAAQEKLKHGTPEALVHDLILARWSPRSFADKPISDAHLKSIFAAAAWAPSSSNEQPWRFLVGRKGDKTYTKIFDALVPANQSWAQSAPVLYCSFGKKTFSSNSQPNPYCLHDTGAASAVITLQAISMGIHTHGMGGFDKETLRASFGVPSDFEAGACWALGYLGKPEDAPEKYRAGETSPRSRKRLAEYVFSDWEKPASF